VTGEVTSGCTRERGAGEPEIANSLYSLDIASFTMGASYDQKDALGFINLIGLPIPIRGLYQK
jgi:argininosuccinate synthase